MSNKITISIDVMGGENAPNALIEAVEIFLKNHADAKVLIYGKKSQIISKITSLTFFEERYKLVNCDDVILDEIKPVDAWRISKNSSMRKTIEAVKNQEAQAAVSSGNTGALMLFSKMILGTLNEIKRPAIAAVFPSIDNSHRGTVILDMGANLECNEINLSHFAVMGSSFAKAVLKIPEPRIGILNVGAESSKGRNLELKTYNLLKNSGLNFYGFVEGHDVIRGVVDVLVTDGFSGNVFLKASEGAARVFLDILNKSITQGTVLSRLAGYILKDSIREPIKMIDPNKNNGAMLMGLKGIVVKSHGSAETIGIYNAITTAYNLAKDSINTKISEGLDRFDGSGEKLGFVNKLKQASVKVFSTKKKNKDEVL